MDRWKGFPLEALKRFHYRRGEHGVELPYLTRKGEVYRWKLFPDNKEYKARWVGDSKPQIPFGLESLKLGGKVLFVTEGESDTIALRLAFPKHPVIGIPGASSWEPRWAEVTTDLFEAVYLCFDADEAGDGTYTGKEHQPKTNLLKEVKQDVPHYRYVMLPKGADTRAFLQAIGLPAYKVLLRAANAAHDERMARQALDRALWQRREVEIAWEKHTGS